ncbi:Toll/interleukin-1 receptor domain-containing protein [Tanacetum coccineum]
MMISRCNDLADLEMLSECLKLEDLDLSHPKLRTLDLGLTPNLKWLKPTDVFPVHSDNDSPKFQFSCYYKEDPSSSFGNLERLISIDIPNSICKMKCINSFDLHNGDRVVELPEQIGSLEGLKELNIEENRGSELPSTLNIDYMGQFSSGDKTKQDARTNKAETSSSRKNSRKSKAQETLQGFMNPKVNTANKITKDAGKRRVQADGQATGHWFTDGDEKRLANFSTQHHSVCNISKLPLTGLGVLTKELGKRKQNVSNVTSASESVVTNCRKQPFPKLTVSPLRKFQLIDSDSDSDIPSISEVATKKTCDKSEPYSNRRKCVNEPRKLSESLDTSTGKDLWEDFRHEKSFHIPTPALDEVCEECLSSPDEKGKVQSSIGKSNNKSHVMDSAIAPVLRISITGPIQHDEPPPTLHYSVSNKSKFPLTGLGLLTRESGKRKQNISNVANSPESVITSCSKQPFPKLTVSPLRKFQLIDSDYDSNIPSIIRKDLWEDFRHEKSFHIPTPALDEVLDLGDPRLPAHQYFFHNDLRVQELVRTRLCNFFSLNAESRSSERPSNQISITCKGQFNSGDKTKQATRTNKAETCSTRKISRKSKTQEMSHGFMNPKGNTAKGNYKRCWQEKGSRGWSRDGALVHKWRWEEGVETYKDDEKIKQGKLISDELIKAIEDSKFYIIVFSKNYASSSWCLEELVKIMECQTMDEHTAYPVFYDVEPTEVRKQMEFFGTWSSPKPAVKRTHVKVVLAGCVQGGRANLIDDDESLGGG